MLQKKTSTCTCKLPGIARVVLLCTTQDSVYRSVSGMLGKKQQHILAREHIHNMCTHRRHFDCIL